MIDLIYLWSFDTPIKRASEMTNLSERVTIQWYQYLWDVCSHWLLNNNAKIGGPGFKSNDSWS